MQFKHLYAIMALVSGVLLTSCHSEIDLTNIDTTAEVEMGLALPVGQLHLTLGDFFGKGMGKFYVDSVDNKGVITWKDTFNIARNFHQVDLAKYISEKQLNLNVYDKIDGTMVGSDKVVTGVGMPITLDFDLPLKLKGINHRDSLARERLDSALIETASFSSVIKTHNLPLRWEWIDRVTLDLGNQIRRPAGSTMVVYDKKRDSYGGYGQNIPTAVDQFTINLMAKNAAGQYIIGQVVDSCDFTVHFTFTIPNGTTVTLPDDASFDYKLGVQFIDYKAIWGKFERSKDMYDESVFDIGSSWGSLDFLTTANMPFADPKIDMYIITKVAGALKVDGDYLYALDAGGARHYASFRYGGQDHQDFHKTFQKWEYLDPITSIIGDSTTNMMIPFDKDPERGQIDKLFQYMPQKLGYKFNLDFDYTQTPQIRITPNTSIRISAICKLPMIFNRGMHVDYNDTIRDVKLSQFSIDSLLNSVTVIDTLKGSNIRVVLHAFNEIPLDVMAYMRCLDENGAVVKDPADPSKPLLLFKQDTITLQAPEYAKVNGIWTAKTPGETTIIANLTNDELNELPKVKHIAYFTSINDASLQEAYEKGLDNVRLTDDESLKLKIGLTAEVDAILNFKNDNK